MDVCLKMNLTEVSSTFVPPEPFDSCKSNKKPITSSMADTTEALNGHVSDMFSCDAELHFMFSWDPEIATVVSTR